MSDITPTPDPKQTAADLKAEKARRKALRPWFKKKRFILPIALILLIAVSRAAGGSSSNSSAGVDTSSSNSNDSSSNPNSGSGSWVTDNYPAFTAVDFAGSGDDVVTLPTGGKAGMITATYKGDSNFVVETLDSSNQTGDLAVNTIGSYQGTTAYGIQSLGGDAVRLKVTASGAWTIHVAPLSEAPALPQAGKGDGVYQFTSSAAPTWAITHTGQSNFTVTEESGSTVMGLLVNEIGNYKGTVAGYSGPGLVIITADGAWTIVSK